MLYPNACSALPTSWELGGPGGNKRCSVLPTLTMWSASRCLAQAHARRYARLRSGSLPARPMKRCLRVGILVGVLPPVTSSSSPSVCPGRRDWSAAPRAETQARSPATPEPVKNSGGSSCVMSGVCRERREDLFRLDSTRQSRTVDSTQRIRCGVYPVLPCSLHLSTELSHAAFPLNDQRINTINRKDY